MRYELALREPVGDRGMRPEEVARRVVAAHGGVGELAFCYGQGSVFSGLVADSDLDIVLVWDGAVPREVERVRSGLDAAGLGGWPVDVVHFPRAVFEGWLRDVAAGEGWREAVWPLPLFAVAGFAYGVVVDDPRGYAGRALAATRVFPPALAERSREALRAEWPSYDRELGGCVRRGDGWLFHELLCRVVRDAYVAWFAAHERYCPHPKRIGQWAQRFGMGPGIAELDGRMWRTAALGERHALVAEMIGAVLREAPR